MSAPSPFRFALADHIAQLAPEAWDRVVAASGLFLSRSFLGLLEANLPGPLSTHYALVFEGQRPVAAVVVQSLDIRAADLASRPLPEEDPGLWRTLEDVARRTQLLLCDDLCLGIDEGRRPPAAEGDPWSGAGAELLHRLRRALAAAEHLAEASVGWVHLRFLVCGNLFSTGPHGTAFAEGEDPARLWPAVLEALERIRRSSPGFSASDMLMVKDLTEAQGGAEEALRGAGFRRFETEPNMVLPLKTSWSSFEDCLRDMKSTYRSSIRKVCADLEASGTHLERLEADQVEAAAPELHALYHQVHDHQKLRLAPITEGWVPALAAAYGKGFRTVAARRGDRILGFVTVLRDGDRAFGTHIGFDKAAAAEGLPLYPALVQAGVAQAIDQGVSHLVLGRTALGPKAQLGALPQPMFGYLRHHSPALNLAVPGILALLPTPERAPERHPFKA